MVKFSKKASLKRIWAIACILGNVLQIIEVSNIFFSYSVVTVVDVDFPSKFRPPTISICFYTIDLVRWEMALTKLPKLKDTLLQNGKLADNITNFVKKLSHEQKLEKSSAFSEQMSAPDVFSLTLNKDDLFENCSLLNQTTYRTVNKPCTQLFKIRPFIRECYKCFSFAIIGDPEYDYLSVMRVTGTNGFIFGIPLVTSVLSRLNQGQVFYSDSGTLPRHGFSCNIWVNPLSQVFQLTFDNYMNTLLPTPYETNCVDYPQRAEDKFENKGHCYESCARNKSMGQFTSLFPGPVIETFRTQKVRTIANMSLQDFIIVRKIEQECDLVCKADDCKQRITIPVLLNSDKNSFNLFTGFLQQTPDIETTYDPKMGLVEFLTQVASTFGFWTGLSLFGGFELVEHAIEYFKARKSFEDERKKSIASTNVSNLTTIGRRIQPPSRARTRISQVSPPIKQLMNEDLKRQFYGRGLTKIGRSGQHGRANWDPLGKNMEPVVYVAPYKR